MGWRRYQHGRNPLCDYCRSPIAFDRATVDHVVPLSAGGKDGPSNWALACRACNVKKGSRSVAAAGMFLGFRRVCTPACEKAMVDYATTAALMARLGRGGRRVGA